MTCTRSWRRCGSLRPVRPVPALVPPAAPDITRAAQGNIYTLKCRYAALPWGREEAALPRAGPPEPLARSVWLDPGRLRTGSSTRSLGPWSFITCKTWVQLLALTHSLVTGARVSCSIPSIIPPYKRIDNRPTK